MNISRCWFGKENFSGFAKHASASLFYPKSSLDFQCRPLASNFAGGIPASGQPANMRRPIVASTENDFEKFG